MIAPARLWTCTTCSREYEAEPLRRCVCGAFEFLMVLARSTADPFGLHVQADLVLAESRRNSPRR